MMYLISDMRQRQDYQAPESEVIRIQAEIRFMTLYGDPQIRRGEETEGGDY